MKKSFLGSVSFHALIVLAALFGIPTAKPFELKPVEAIQVDISNITDQTKVKAQTKSDEKPAEKPKPKASKVEEKTKPQEKVTEEKKVAAKEPAKEEPPPPEPEKKPEPEKPKEPEKKVEDTPVDPDPLKDMLIAEEAELKAAEEQKKKDEEKKKKDEAKKKKAEEEKKKKEDEKAAAEAKAKADAKKKLEAERKARKLDVAKLEDLLNKENTEATATLEKKDETGTPEKAQEDVQGTDDAVSATIIDGLTSRFNDCWPIPASVRESKETVDLQWKLSQDGRVIGQPVVVGGNGGAVAQQAAIAAVMECAPYDWLPKDAYNVWKSIEWTFAPQ
jgi:colicin import membrane protein